MNYIRAALQITQIERCTLGSSTGKVPTVGPVFSKYVYLPVALNVSEATATTSRASGDADNIFTIVELIPIRIKLVDDNNSSHPVQAQD